jgi:hypothetical protein
LIDVEQYRLITGLRHFTLELLRIRYRVAVYRCNHQSAT